MEFKKLIDRAVSIRKKYLKLEMRKYGRSWTGEETVMGFVGDVGDLMKIIMAKEGVRSLDDVDEKLAHELSDCLWSIIVLAQHYNIDLERTFMLTMDDIEKNILQEAREKK